MEDTSSSHGSGITGNAKVKQVTMAVEQPFLARLDSESIRVFLRKYDAYCRELKARASQLVQETAVSLEPIRPVGLVYCVDAEQLESAVDLGMIDGCDDVKELTDGQLRDYLDKEASDSATVVTENDLAQMVQRYVRMDMSVKSAHSRMKLLFMGYKSLLRQNGMGWVVDKNPKAAVRHIISVVKPAQLKTRLEQDIGFSKADLKSDFKGFMQHALELSVAFEKLDNGNPRANKTDTDADKGKKEKSGKKPGSPHKSTGQPGTGKGKKREPPSPCPLPPCKGKGLMHWADDCEEATAAEKKAYKDNLAAKRASDGPARSTRSQASSAGDAASSSTRNVGRLRQETGESNDDSDTPSCIMTVTDLKSTLDFIGRCDDGSDENLATPPVAERAALKGIGEIQAIDTVRLQVALSQKDEEPRMYAFSRAWSVPTTVLNLSSGRLALKNLRFLIPDDAVASEDMLIGRPVLRHLRVDTKTLLEERVSSLDGTDCSPDLLPKANGGHVSRLMLARLNRVNNDEVDTPPTADPTRPKVNYFSARAEEDPLPDPSLLDPIDEEQHEDIKTAVDDLRKQAFENGLASDRRPMLGKLLSGHMDIFRTSFSSGPPARLPPLEIELTNDATPVKVRLRKYSSDQRDFMYKFVQDLVRHGLAYANPTSKWACAPLLVPKPGSLYRFTVDIRPVNKFTIRYLYPMPNIEIELTTVAGSKFFAVFDFSHSYWQLLLAKQSQECQSFITPDGIFTPTRVLHGTTNAVAHLQSSIAGIIPDDLKPNILCWLDDILLHAPTVDKLLESIQSFFGMCAEYNLKLHPAKCTLFAKEIRWCGRLLSAEGIRYDPRRLEGLLTMKPPTNGANLQQFICALQWVKQGIPNFTELVAPLHEFMERVYDHATKRTKRAVVRVQLSTLGWGKTELDAFESCKHALAHQVTLAHRDSTKRLCVYTDASDTAWSGIITQVPHAHVHRSHAEQDHAPLAFLSGRFNATQLGWSVLEKEAYAVLTTLDRMHWIVATTDGFDLYTDHNNLIFLFDPLSVVPDLSATTLRKVLRWAVRLSMYRYTCYHIKGDDNVWADLMSRWSSSPATIRRIVRVPELPSSSATDFDWPSRDAVFKVQQEHAASRPAHFILDDQLWIDPDSKAIWIPDDATDIQLRLCIIAHTGPAGHRGAASTEQSLWAAFHWSTMNADVRTFVRACIHCLSTVGGEKVPRPFGPAVHGTKANDLLQFDYIELGVSQSGYKYVLMMRDDHSDYKWFIPTASTAAQHAATAIIDWCSSFGVPNGLMSDGPTHFRNEVVRLVCKGLKVPHHFTLPYCPWSNGAVERLGKELIRVNRAVLSELQMRHTEWPDILPLVQSVLNNSPSPARANVSPVMAFLGREATPPIRTFLRSKTLRPVTLSEAQAERAFNVKDLIKIRDEIHPLVQQSLSSHREQSRAAASKGKLPNFEEGDFVLVARDEYGAGDKLLLRWRGPRRVTKALNDFVYQVEDLRTGQLDEAHASRLKFYRDDDIDTDVIMSHVLHSEIGMSVSRLMGLQEDPDGLKVIVRWKGLSNSEDSAEPLKNVYEDVPKMVKRLLLRKSIPVHLVNKARAALAL